MCYLQDSGNQRLGLDVVLQTEAVVAQKQHCVWKEQTADRGREGRVPADREACGLIERCLDGSILWSSDR